MELYSNEIREDTPREPQLYTQRLDDTSRFHILASTTPRRDPLDTD